MLQTLALIFTVCKAWGSKDDGVTAQDHRAGKMAGLIFKSKPMYSKAHAFSTSHFLPVGGGNILRQENASFKLYSEYECEYQG